MMVWSLLQSAVQLVRSATPDSSVAPGALLTKENAVVVAALISAVVSILSLRSNREIARVVDLKDERKLAREQTRNLAKLMDEADASVRKLVSQASILEPNELILEAIDTFGAVSAVFEATNGSAEYDYPDDVAIQSKLVRKRLTELLLELEIAEDRRKLPVAIASLKSRQAAVTKEIENCRSMIRKHVATLSG